MARPPIVLLTDFGQQDPFVGIMKGVILGLAPAAPIVDLCHEVPAHELRAAALHLRASVPFFPAGSIFVCVVDPGVGSARKALWARSARQHFLAPDNGVLSWLPDPLLEFRELSDPGLGLAPRSATFHGRDLFAPAAAKLWLGARPASFGPAVARPERFPFPEPARSGRRARGEILHIDRFGNAVTNLSAWDAKGARLFFRGRALGALAGHYAAARPGGALALVGSMGLVELSVREGSFARRWRAKVGDPVECRS